MTPSCPTPSPCFFFFQAEDGIRDVAVTGVQTCALPISPNDRAAAARERLVHVLLEFSHASRQVALRNSEQRLDSTCFDTVAILLPPREEADVEFVGAQERVQQCCMHPAEQRGIFSRIIRPCREDASPLAQLAVDPIDRKSTRLNSSHGYISYAVFCLKKK